MVEFWGSSFEPIFVVGASRSGTTLMGRILERNADVFTFHELHFFEQLWCSADIDRILDESQAQALAMRLFSIQREGFFYQGSGHAFREDALKILGRISSDRRTTDLFRVFLQYETERAGKRRACDQTPRNVFYLNEILSVYPGAHIVVMVRDPRDVIFSQKKKYLRRKLGATSIPLREAVRSRINYHPITISKLWRSAVVSALRAKNRSNVHFVFFERLMSEPESVVRSLCRDLGLEYSDAMLAVPRVGSSHGEDGGVGIVDASGRWRASNGLSQTEVALCEWMNGDLLQLLGFKESGARVRLLALVGWMLYFPIHLALAMLLNFRRMRNMFETLKKRLGT